MRGLLLSVSVYDRTADQAFVRREFSHKLCSTDSNG